MNSSIKASIVSYLRSLIPFRILPKNKFSWLLVCSSAPLILGSSVVTVAAPQQIVQVITSTANNRPTLRAGSQGNAVSELQAALKLLGFYTGEVDGNYNENTASAVSQFKQAAGLKPDGIVDASTWQRLFPSDSLVASREDTNNSANSFPTPTETATTTRVVNATPEPKPTTKPKPKTSNINTTRVVNATPEPKPATPNTKKPNRTTTSQRTTVQQSSSGSRIEQTTRQQTTRTGGSNARNTQTTRSVPPERRQNTTNRTEETPGIQYTAGGLPILRLGNRGTEVVKLQQRLQRQGFFKGDIDGDFGAETEAAVRAAQENYGLKPDGIAGGETWEFLNRRRTQRQQ
ncbi:MAG: peptidoglycan-binding protein [Cyanomargarita calcarea GSE-NOS-MK-12-04C]|jgi:peptidoglycan hydrolase-like protein with peptidoglycan-binding domain|uniref:Peptidoglycan-binding protein n=1 Tax=Cyanomargarita calcarea GSE-NOS-MK-12-04C TaxID=2839659 RepID=A0A951QP00_9CYAN|nr:peptidoglycan-binding protein [Cyanomargarita calcarea GSE-NOS-MK-12-04C]